MAFIKYSIFFFSQSLSLSTGSWRKKAQQRRSMKKKGVPEWMNSPLWSSHTQSPPPPPLPTDYPSSSLSTKEAADRLHGEQKQETINRTPPPTMTIQKHCRPPILTPVYPAPVAESLRDSYPQPRFSLEEASRWSQISEEVRVSIVNIMLLPSPFFQIR